MAQETETDPLLRVVGRLIGRIQYDAMQLAAAPASRNTNKLALDIAANAQAAWRLLGYSDEDMGREILRQELLAEEEEVRR